MNNKDFREVTRITLMIHHGLLQTALDIFKSLGVYSVLLESSRTVRIHDNTTLLSLVGLQDSTEDSPTDLLRVTVAPDVAEAIVYTLVGKLDLRTPGRGTVYAQNLLELSDRKLPEINVDHIHNVNLMHDLTMITGIQSKSASGDNISKVALKMGVGLPTVSLGKGTGIRDRLGLLRITISPEKEITYLLVPSFDANGLQNLLIEKGKLNQPGGGFMYQTPVRFGLVDPLLRVGKQQNHAASLEQIVAAIDDLKKSTAWRKRMFDHSANGKLPSRTSYTHREISFICQVEHSDDYVQVAMDHGAAGATMTSMRCVDLIDKTQDLAAMNYENAIMCIKKEDEDRVIEAITKLAEEKGETNWLVQKIPASSIYATYKKK